MKKILFGLLQLVLLFSLTGCDNGSDNGKGKGEQLKLQLYAKIEGLNVNADPYKFLGGQNVGLWISSTNVESNLSAADQGCNLKFSQSAGGLVHEPRVTLPAKSDVYMYAYAPYDETAAKSPEAYLFSVSKRQDTSALSDQRCPSDLIWAKNNVTFNGDIVNVQFRHLMSKFVVNLKSSSNMPGSLIGSEVSICSTHPSAKVNLGNGTFTIDGNTDDIVMHSRPEALSGYEMSYEAVVVPQTLDAGIKFLNIKTLGGYSYSWNLDKSITVEQGKVVTLDVTIDEGECEVVIKEITDWVESGNAISGVAKEDLPEYNVYDYYNRGGIKGIVVKVDDSRQHGWIVSLDEVEKKWSIYNDYYNYSPDAYDKNNSLANLNGALAKDPTLEIYPAIKWCNDKNVDGVTGWVLPASNVLFDCLGPILSYDLTAKDFEAVKLFNKAIQDCPVDASQKKEIVLNTSLSFYAYYSSTISMTDNVRCLAGYPNYVLYPGYESFGCMLDNLQPQKNTYRVRAFHEF